MNDELILELPVRMRGGSLHLNIHSVRGLMGVEHGDTVRVKLSNIEVIKHPVNEMFEKVMEERLKKELMIKAIPNNVVKDKEKRKKIDYEVL